MLVAAIAAFAGANTAINPKKLPPGIGVSAINLDTSQADMRGLPAASLAHTLTGLGVQQMSIYRMGRDAASDTAYWLTSSDDYDYARSMLASDTTERTYFTGAAEPRYTDNTLLGSPPYPTGYVELGVPAPTVQMALALGAPGTGPDETRVYTDVFKRANGDRSGPNTNSATIVVAGGSTVSISGLGAAPGGSHGITLREIYVSVSGGEFQRALEQAVATTTATDTGVRGDVLQSGGSTSRPTWLEPPDDLKGIIELWNGMHGGFHGKAWRVCVPFEAHAWPLEYRKMIPHTIVGSAAWGENWLLATTGQPYVVTGSAPMGMSARPIRWKQACVSKRSVRSVGHGVCWASNSGLAYHGQRGTFLLTKDVLTEAQWRALVPSTIIGACWGDWYIGFYNDGARKGFMVNTVAPAGIIFLTQGAYGVFEDTVSETLFLLDSGNLIKKWDAGSPVSATYRTGVIRHPYAVSPSSARVIATTYPVSLSMWADGTQVVNAMTISDDGGVRLPGDFEAEEFQFELTGTGPIEALFVGEEMMDLP